MVKPISLAAALLLLWIALSTLLEPYHLIVGLVAALLCTALAQRLGLIDVGRVPYRLLIRLPQYAGWLGVRIIQSNLHVAGQILRPNISLSQNFQNVEARQRTDLARAIFANSITLTPGTVTVETGDAQFLVHALTQQSGDTKSLMEMGDKVLDLEGRG
jgi:multicomponent Na+:H+ antiporter subunit E